MDLVAGSKYFAYLGFDDERMIEPGAAVEVDTIPNSHLIQTDKGIYKPGELGRVRSTIRVSRSGARFFQA